ncbi:hypothetical protein [Actinoplanes subglobosus]|uniref:Uncharacterized protein n=1 Tax=Actinoplanes subglobosus TaxID=1547892 RepID=A0ABV8IZ86_9ACTN
MGSAEAGRQYSPPLRDADNADGACVEIGAALAEAGCDLLLFSSRARYVEAAAFRGFAGAGAGGRVVVRPPQHATVEFQAPEGSTVEVQVEHDASGEWELPYYRSLMTCDGVVIVGGGQASRIAGLFALLHQVPVLPVAAFGGGAAQVRTNLTTIRNDITDDDLKLLGRPWKPGLGADLATSLLGQVSRRRERQVAEDRARERGRWANRIALVVTAIAVIATWLSFPLAGTVPANSPLGLLLLVVAPMLAAVAGALLRSSRRGDGQWAWPALSGLAAGFLTVFLYLVGELVSVPDLFERLNTQRLLLFLAPLAFISGLTFDQVLERVLKGNTRVPSAGAGLPPV